MKMLLLYFLLANYYIFAQPMDDSNIMDLRYLDKIQNLFCAGADKCSSASHTTLNNTPSGSESTMTSATRYSGISTSTPFSAPEMTLPVMPPPVPGGLNCCGQCLCELDKCDITDSCCIKALEELPYGNVSSVRMTCDYPQLRPYDIAYPNLHSPALMFRDCPRGSISNIETINKCENSKRFDELYTKIPVTDVTTMYVYKNRYCAYCHNVSESNLHYWEATLECLHGILQPRDINSVISEILGSKACNLLYHRPVELGGPLYQCKMVISKCNVTGNWRKYDPVIEAACLAYSTIFNFEYRNVFCYLCNTNDASGPLFCNKIPGPIIFVDFRALLKFQPDVSTVPDSKVPDRCSVDQIHDPLKNMCRNKECLFPKTIENGECVYLVQNLGGLSFGIFLKLTPLDGIEISDFFQVFDVVVDLKQTIVTWINDKVQNTALLSLYIYGKLYTNSSEVSEETSYSITYFVVYVEASFSVRSPVSSDIIDYMLSIQDTIVDTGNKSRNKTGVKYKVEVDSYNVTEVGDAQLSDPSSGELSILLRQGIETEYPKTILGVVNTCPLIRINRNEFRIARQSLSIYIEELNATIDVKNVLIEEDETNGGESFSLRMCAQMFEELMEPFTGHNKSQNDCKTVTISSNAILSLVCSSISLTFSVLTVLIYLRFKELKTQPGINNIVLCTSLVIAQTLFQFGSGQSCNVSKVACQVIGILVHFSWLFLFFWMNSCCIHMFRVFRLSQNRMALFNTTKTTAVYIFYSFSASMILVLTNVFVSLNGSEGHDIGYGGILCYINNGPMVTYFFALPVAVVVLMNMILFVIVMLQMKKSPKIQNDRNERNLLHIYTRLSTITGCTWVFGFLSFFLNVTALDYIFIILNASQGTFLFFAFVVNKRTLNLLMKKDHVHTGHTRNTQTYSREVGITQTTASS